MCGGGGILVIMDENGDFISSLEKASLAMVGESKTRPIL